MPGVGARPAEGVKDFSRSDSSLSTLKPFDWAQDLRCCEEGMLQFEGNKYAVGDM